MKSYERKDKRGRTLKALRFPLVYISGFVLGIFVLILRLLGRVKIECPERFPKGMKRIIIASNHPSAFEPWLMVGIFFSEYIFHPLLYIPYIVSDKKLFRRWFLYPIWDRMIFLERGNIREELLALLLIALMLRRHKRVIIFPEAGRTGRGDKKVYSEKGHPLRPLKYGIGSVALLAGATIVPVWIYGTDKVLPIGTIFPRLWRKIVVRWGEPIPVSKVRGRNRKKIAKKLTSKLQDTLLKLADE